MKIFFQTLRTPEYMYAHAYDEDSDTHLGCVCVALKDVEFARYKSLCKGDKLAKIIRVETNRSFTNLGVASGMLNEVVKQLEGWNIYLNVVPCPRSDFERHALTRERLVHFYAKFGFKMAPDVLTTTMFRTAR